MSAMRAGGNAPEGDGVRGVRAPTAGTEGHADLCFLCQCVDGRGGSYGSALCMSDSHIVGIVAVGS